MKRFAGMAVLLVVGCTPKTPVEESDPGPRFPPHSAPAVPTGPLGQADDRVLQWGDAGQWLAVCRPRGEHEVPRLVLGTEDERTFDRLESSDESGRWVLMTHDGHRWLFDIQSGRSTDLGTIAATTHGDLRAGTLAYGRRGDGPPVVVRVDLATGAEHTMPSPMPSLHAVQIDRSGHGLWLTGSSTLTPSNRQSVAEEDAHYARQRACTTTTPCRGARDLPRRYKGLLWLEEPTPTFVELDDAPLHPRALAGAVVHDGGSGVELVEPDRRVPIAPGCRLVTEHYDPSRLLLRCEEEDDRERYAQWHDGTLERLEIWASGEAEPENTTVLRGADDRWLELSGLRVIRAEHHASWAHAHGDHVALVGEGVEIRDARTDARVTHIPGRFEALFADGPHVALRSLTPDPPLDQVIDLRDGHVVRTHTGPALQLAATGQMLVRNPDGRLRWTTE